MIMDELGDNYRVIKFLNEGGFGKAYLCEDRRTSEQCVVKVGITWIRRWIRSNLPGFIMKLS